MRVTTGLGWAGSRPQGQLDKKPLSPQLHRPGPPAMRHGGGSGHSTAGHSASPPHGQGPEPGCPPLPPPQLWVLRPGASFPLNVLFLGRRCG